MNTTDEKKTDTYAVPGEVGIALMTGRTEFLKTLEGSVRRGEVIPPDQVIEMIRLCKDLIDERARNHQRLAEIEKRIDQVVDVNKGIATKADEIDGLIDAIRRDRDPAQG